MADYSVHCHHVISQRMPCLFDRHTSQILSFRRFAEVMNKEHEVAAAAANQLTEQLAVQQLAAKQALKQVGLLQIS